MIKWLQWSKWQLRRWCNDDEDEDVSDNDHIDDNDVVRIMIILMTMMLSTKTMMVLMTMMSLPGKQRWCRPDTRSPALSCLNKCLLIGMKVNIKTSMLILGHALTKFCQC